MPFKAILYDLLPAGEMESLAEAGFTEQQADALERVFSKQNEIFRRTLEELERTPQCIRKKASSTTLTTSMATLNSGEITVDVPGNALIIAMYDFQAVVTVNAAGITGGEARGRIQLRYPTGTVANSAINAVSGLFGNLNDTKVGADTMILKCFARPPRPPWDSDMHLQTGEHIFRMQGQKTSSNCDATAYGIGTQLTLLIF